MANNISIDDFLEIIESTKFYSDTGSDFIIECEFLNIINLNNFNFTNRFNITRKSLNLNNLTDILNTEIAIFLNKLHCGLAAITLARKEISDYFRKFARDNNCFDLKSLLSKLNYENNYNSLELCQSAQEEYFLDKLRNVFPFFKKVFNYPSILLSDLPEYKLLYSIKEISFNVRFSHYLESNPEIITVNDLLLRDISKIASMENIGKKSIYETRKILYNFLTTTYVYSKNENIPLEELIMKRIKEEFRDKKYYEIFLLRYGYDVKKEYTLCEIGEKYHITRERARQILERYGNNIFKKKSIIKEIIDELIKRSAVSNIKSFISELNESKKIFKHKNTFLLNLVRNTLIYDERFKFANDFVYLIENIKNISGVFDNICQIIANHISKIRSPILVDKVLMIIKDKSQIPHDELIYYVNRETLIFMSITYKNIFIVGNFIYDKILFNLYYGKSISDITDAAMRNLNEPIHFKLLIDYIRKNNKVRKNISEGSVVNILRKSKKYIMVEWGVYSLNNNKIKQYHSAINLIIELLKIDAPLTETQILNMLKGEYTDWNIKMALKNNIDKKIIKIGNDLYDLK